MSILDLQLEHIPSPLGEVLILTDAQCRLRALDWHDNEGRLHTLLRRQYAGTTITWHDAHAASSAAQAIRAYFDGDITRIDTVAVETGGTPFQQAVWSALRDIAHGATESYGALAQRIGRPTAVRAVGLANGANPISIVLPCHRVIGANQSLTGYGGGLTRKRWLLAHEHAHAPNALAGVSGRLPGC